MIFEKIGRIGKIGRIEMVGIAGRIVEKVGHRGAVALWVTPAGAKRSPGNPLPKVERLSGGVPQPGCRPEANGVSR